MKTDSDEANRRAATKGYEAARLQGTPEKEPAKTKKPAEGEGLIPFPGAPDPAVL